MTGTGIDILHVPYTFFPDPVGGTEIYVAGLIATLRGEGFSNAVAAPGAVNDAYQHNGVAVYRFAQMESVGLKQAYGEPDEIAARSFAELLARVQPRIVHLHAYTSAVSELLVDAAHATDAKVIFTYHTPTVSCVRGTMMLMGRVPCDGAIYIHRCTACMLQRHGLPWALREALALTPRAFGRALARANLSGSIFIALRLPALIEDRRRRFHALMNKADRVVAICQWVADCLEANGIEQAKIVLCRQGLVGLSAQEPIASGNRSIGILRLGYFGRIDSTKGIDILVEALRQMPDASISLDIYGLNQERDEYFYQLQRSITDDPRINIRAALDQGSVSTVMRELDFVVVPSRWLETGPLVVLEAFSAGTPVLGARLGGIAELVTNNVDGVLIDPDNTLAWAETIQALAGDPDRCARLRNAVPKPRTMYQVAKEMAAVYQSLLSGLQYE